MTRQLAIHEVKNQLSGVIARLAETGEAVEITKHGNVVAVLIAPPSRGIVLGLGARPGGRTPDLDDLRWSDAELSDMLGDSPFPA